MKEHSDAMYVGLPPCKPIRTFHIAAFAEST